MSSETKANKTNFIKNIIKKDIGTKKVSSVLTRFPPEPNGYLHIGHAKSICLNFGIAEEFGGKCNLRFDDTNPDKEDIEYINAIREDVEWLGFRWENEPHFASEYFDKMYELAILLIKKGKAYVCDLSAEEVREYRGTLKEPGRDSPYRERSLEENLKLFEAMKNGEFAEGSKTLRAKIDMASGNINLRDPALYRIKFSHHPKTGNKWCIYPMYAFAHPLEDAIETITHSLCTLEFQDQRPFYDWVIEETEFQQKPQQIEFSRLNLNYTITSKRKLKYLVDNNLVSGWDDPRMPTIKGFRRRGYTPESIRNFCDMIGISKQDSIIDISVLEETIRDDLNKNALRKNAVLDPIKVTIANMPVHELNVPNHPQDPEFGRRDITISSDIYIERDDFVFELEKDMKKLSPNGRVRLLNAYVIECKEVITNDDGEIIELICSYLPETLGGKKPNDGIKPNGIIHWVDANNCIDAEVRVYDRLFNHENPASFDDVEDVLNPDSLQIIKNAKVEKSLENITPEQHFQFNRIGYFISDLKDCTNENLVFNRTVTLRNTWEAK
ncbi:glutamine--tRNA ligase/YqeY domain fusion protein [Francisella philomiragia]|uniref:glutamine--tRNA ligase/YqeY domain fusion protein n=1 Tax=Francisella philomiragia TaxID=28110 RepID=UPI001908749B|nr:glutamine--tRNA ligase/YqeY domain fusion protein [Francisella philomiragia]MBK2094010.1 glutamine--tRNA ligase/YqeY domain fusion protein [Francisella philomiragia]MBK2256481.1 glutamine--tRNA ligase/YqeY domain fusion protein [Francisella philomiragia]MBK2269139.1 glutamine--tRNA ligase/YqeY domain fusion protein [Francisella philomiragia]MBK2270387.1 glutamine--tRNA ligase/YqeY domain fusion protein [Francisella philomiragia]MBK2274166.1 glutamine--tRNA ligase/YqeY domain fusion protein 